MKRWLLELWFIYNQCAPPIHFCSLESRSTDYKIATTAATILPRWLHTDPKQSAGGVPGGWGPCWEAFSGLPAPHEGPWASPGGTCPGRSEGREGPAGQELCLVPPEQHPQLTRATAGTVSTDNDSDLCMYVLYISFWPCISCQVHQRGNNWST